MSTEAFSPISTYFRVCDGVRVRFADNRADSDITMLLLAPWPESLWAFRRIWDRVSAVGRVGGTMTLCRGRTTSTSTTSSPTARSILSTRVISRGNKQRRNTAAWSSTGSAAGIGASQRANLSTQVEEQIPPRGITTSTASENVA
jgi:hypothetical protein